MHLRQNPATQHAGEKCHTLVVAVPSAEGDLSHLSLPLWCRLSPPRSLGTSPVPAHPAGKPRVRATSRPGSSEVQGPCWLMSAAQPQWEPGKQQVLSHAFDVTFSHGSSESVVERHRPITVRPSVQRCPVAPIPGDSEQQGRAGGSSAPHRVPGAASCSHSRAGRGWKIPGLHSHAWYLGLGARHSSDDCKPSAGGTDFQGEADCPASRGLRPKGHRAGPTGGAHSPGDGGTRRAVCSVQC